MRRALQTYAFLKTAGAFARWDVIAWVAILTYAIYLWREGEDVESALTLALFILPIAAGTGVLTLAREGQLDLLFGSGASRWGVWIVALVRAWLLPLGAISVAAGVLADPGSRLLLPPRTFAAGAITGGICFAVGLVEPRYVAGVLWCGWRIAFVLIPAGRMTFLRIAQPEQAGAPTVLQAFAGFASFPELLLKASVHPVAAAALLAFSGMAVAGSWAHFRRADFQGHRT